MFSLAFLCQRFYIPISGFFLLFFSFVVFRVGSSFGVVFGSFSSVLIQSGVGCAILSDENYVSL